MSCEPDGSNKRTGPACDDCGASAGSDERWNTRDWAPDAGLAQDAVRAAAERVCWFDWSDNDMDAVAAIDALRKAITSSVPSTVQRRPDETGDEYEARVGLIPSKQGNTP